MAMGVRMIRADDLLVFNENALNRLMKGEETIQKQVARLEQHVQALGADNVENIAEINRLKAELTTAQETIRVLFANTRVHYATDTSGANG